MAIIAAIALYVMGLFSTRIALQAELLMFVLYRVIARKNLSRRQLSLAPRKIYRLIRVIRYRRKLFIIKIKIKHKEAKLRKKRQKTRL